MKALTESEIQSFLASDAKWRLSDGQLVREWIFSDFVEAMRFVNQVAELAEGHGHHPDIDIRYNKVRLGLVTHDANGVSERDLKMVGALNSF